MGLLWSDSPWELFWSMYVMHLAEVFVIWAYFMISSSCRPMSEDEHTFACQSDDNGSEFNLGWGLQLEFFDLSFLWGAREAYTQWILRACTQGSGKRSTLMVLDQNLNLGWGLLLEFFDLSLHWGAKEACTPWILRARTHRRGRKSVLIALNQTSNMG